jgi:tetratricopeptide (TPR) repeat protein
MQNKFDKAFLLCQDGKFSEAVAAFNEYIGDNCSHFEAFYNRGLAHFYLQNYAEALSDFDAAHALNAYIPDLISQRGVTHFHLKNLPAALQDLERAANLEPKNPFRYASRAFIKSAMGDLKGAIEDYEKTISLDPEDAVAYNNLGLLQEQLGYKEKAEKNFEKADILGKEFFAEPPSTDEERISKEEFDALLKKNIPDQKSELPNENPDTEKSAKKKSVFETAKFVFSSKENWQDFTLFVKNKFKNI